MQQYCDTCTCGDWAAGVLDSDSAGDVWVAAVEWGVWEGGREGGTGAVEGEGEGEGGGSTTLTRNIWPFSDEHRDG